MVRAENIEASLSSMIRKSLEQTIDYLDNKYLEKEIENTLFPERASGRHSRLEWDYRPYSSSRQDPIVHRRPGYCYTLDEAVSRNINNTLNNSFFSIYGSNNNGIWSSKPTSSKKGDGNLNVPTWSDLGYGRTKSIGAGQDYAQQEETPFFYSDTPRSEKFNMRNILRCPSITGNCLTGRLIEDTLKIPLPPQQPRLSARQLNSRTHHYFSSQNVSSRSHGRYTKEFKALLSGDIKEFSHDSQRKDPKRHERKQPKGRTCKGTLESSGKAQRTEGPPEFTEAGSLSNVLEASEIWLRHTTTSNFSNKKTILKKHYINEDQFYVGVD
ncbi:hypothetical protein BgAZ_108730 [Babesia gibsoni]|uniref:Uncharacterized protein n=1 Tax=Babesia gibsoni TaxID=33632 RepID=A0AAD8PGX4_BABGI|nr:hypothetical protein BgAZ_108730 [Babesia gibsoni]